MPIADENQQPSYEEFEEPDSSIVAKSNALRELYMSLEAKSKSAEFQRDTFRAQLETAQEEIRQLKEDDAQEVLKKSTTAKSFEFPLDVKRIADQTRNKALEEIARLKGEKEELEQLYGEVCNENTDLAMRIPKMANNVSELSSESAKLKEQVETSAKYVKSLTMDSEFEKKEVEDLRATINHKFNISKILEKKAQANKTWTEELSEHKEMWDSRVEHLEESRRDCIHYAQGLEQGLGLLEGRMSIITDDMEQAVFDLDDLDEVIELNSGRTKCKDDDIVEGSDDGCYHLATCKKCIQRSYPCDHQGYILDTHKELIRRLSGEVEEEKAIVRDQAERVLELENFLRERDIQLIDLKNEAARKERELRLTVKEELYGLDQDLCRLSISRSI